MKELTIQVTAGLIVALLVAWFGFSGRSERVVVVQQRGRDGKKWKWFIVIAWIMIIEGLYLFGSNFNQGEFMNLWTNVGFSSLFVGIILLGVGRFGHWWSH